MQVGNNVNGSYGVSYPKNDKRIQDMKSAPIEKKFLPDEEQEDIVSVDNREVSKYWMSMGTKVRESLEKQEEVKERDDIFDSSDEEYRTLLHEQIEEMQQKIASGEINETFQIGAESYTIDEWNELLEKFDAIQEVIQELMKERHEKLEKEKLEEERKKDGETVAEMLLSESTTSTHPILGTNGEDIHFITWYTENGIFCRKAGQISGYEWSLPFENKGQYDHVMEFLHGLSDQEDLQFTADFNFWQDFLMINSL